VPKRGTGAASGTVARVGHVREAPLCFDARELEASTRGIRPLDEREAELLPSRALLPDDREVQAGGIDEARLAQVEHQSGEAYVSKLLHATVELGGRLDVELPYGTYPDQRTIALHVAAEGLGRRGSGLVASWRAGSVAPGDLGCSLPCRVGRRRLWRQDEDLACEVRVDVVCAHEPGDGAAGQLLDRVDQLGADGLLEAVVDAEYIVVAADDDPNETIRLTRGEQLSP
jgi:hypothetical protein